MVWEAFAEGYLNKQEIFYITIIFKYHNILKKRCITAKALGNYQMKKKVI